MESSFYTNRSEVKFLEKLKYDIDHCDTFLFSVSFIKIAGLKLISPNIEAALERGARGKIITTTYQNFTDVDSLKYFLHLQETYPNSFACHLDRECFYDFYGNTVGFHSKGYLFSFNQKNELLIGSSNITVYALLKNVEWDVSVNGEAYQAAETEFDRLWEDTLPLKQELIREYATKIYYAVERWDMDYDIANAKIQPNYMQKRALKELNRIRNMGASKALVVASPGSGKTYLAAFDVLNFNPTRMLYIVHESSILQRSLESFQIVFGNSKSFGVMNGDAKEMDKDFIFATNVTMANHLDLLPQNTFDYIIIDAYGIIGLNSKGSANKGFLKLSPILFSPQMRLMIDLRRKHAQNEDLSAKRSAACNSGSTVSDVVPSRLLQRQSAEHTPDVDLHRSTVRYSKDVSLACAA